MNFNVGDKIQIKIGSIDVTNGLVAKKGQMYVEGSPLRATISAIIENYKTAGRWNLPNEVTKIVCISKNGDIVWQVMDTDIASNIIKNDIPVQNTVSRPNIVETTEVGRSELNQTDAETEEIKLKSDETFTTTATSQSWSSGILTSVNTHEELPSSTELKANICSGTSMGINNFL